MIYLMTQSSQLSGLAFVVFLHASQLVGGGVPEFASRYTCWCIHVK